ncbi:MAG: hypothetical protein ACRDGQ_10185, partial [Candidatus Limnocylindrales bacterium]
MNLEPKALAQAIKVVQHAAAKTNDRPVLATILFEPWTADDGQVGLALVAGDNYRLARARLTAFNDGPWPERALLGIEDVPTLLAWLGSAKHEDFVVLTCQAQTITLSARNHGPLAFSRRMGDFPEYEQVYALGKRTLALGVNPTFLRALGAGIGSVGRISLGASPNDPIHYSGTLDGG